MENSINDTGNTFNSTQCIHDSQFKHIYTQIIEYSITEEECKIQAELVSLMLATLNLPITGAIQSNQRINNNILNDKEQFISDHSKNLIACTAIGVITAIEEFLRRNKFDDPLKGKKISIQGWQKDTGYLYNILKNRAEIVSISNDFGTLQNLDNFDPSNFHNQQSELAPIHEIYSISSDILITCSNRINYLEISDAEKIITHRPMIFPANIYPYTEESLKRLERNGIICFPGFVSCAGQVIDFLFKELTDEKLEEYSKQVLQALSRDLIRAGRACGIAKSLYTVALERAEQNIAFHKEYIEDFINKEEIQSFFLTEYSLTA